MKIAVISDSRRRGGAALATARVFDALASSSGWEIRWFVSQADGTQDDQTTVFTGAGVVRRAMQSLGGGREPWRRTWLRAWARVRNRRNLLRLVRLFQPDVISLHSINDWTDAALRRTIVCDLGRLAPLAWTLHDMWPLTGYSDYPEEYVNPRLSSDEAWHRVFDRSPVQQEARKIISCGQRLTWVAPSKWIGELAERQFGGALRVVNIAHGVNVQDFRPVPLLEARQWLDIPTDRPVVVAAAHSLQAKRKGMAILIDALKHVPFPISVALIGSVSNDWNWPTHVRAIKLGYLSDARLLRAAYSAADVFVLSSLAEMFGLVVIEAMACGTPCVAFATGGPAEIIQPGKTGYLVPRGDSAALAHAIAQVLRQTPEEKAAMRAACRCLVEQEYDLRMEVQRYADLLSELVGGKAR